MRIGLISTYTHPFALGLRYVSSYLKTMGHDVSVCFMSSHRDTTAPDFSAAALADLVERLRPCALIGLSLMTNTFRRAQFLTEHLRNAGLRAPIVWGGTHPTVAPEECLEIADAVCVGEARKRRSSSPSGLRPAAIRLASRAGGSAPAVRLAMHRRFVMRWGRWRPGSMTYPSPITNWTHTGWASGRAWCQRPPPICAVRCRHYGS